MMCDNIIDLMPLRSS